MPYGAAGTTIAGWVDQMAIQVMMGSRYGFPVVSHK
jgi:hypothetical protein